MVGAGVAVAANREDWAGNCKKGKGDVACDSLYDFEDLANLHALNGFGSL